MPAELALLTNLRFLNLDDNLLSGKIPPVLSEMYSLERVSLHNNFLEGAIPASLDGLTRLRRLSLAGNNLIGEMPEELGNLVLLEDLDLHDNELSGEIPTHLSELSNLTSLDLSGNRLTGSLPSSLGNLVSLSRIDLASNGFQGLIPATIVNLPLAPNASDFRWNALSTDNTTVTDFLKVAQSGGNWEISQTISPTSLRAEVRHFSSMASLELAWTPVFHPSVPGGYLVFRSQKPLTDYQLVATVPSREQDSLRIDNLSFETDYFFQIRSYSAIHAENQNEVIGLPSKTLKIETAPAPVPILSLIGVLLMTFLFSVCLYIANSRRAVCQSAKK